LNPFQIEQKDHYNGPEAEKGRSGMPKEPERAPAGHRNGHHVVGSKPEILALSKAC
jgi:hypothetical protein